MTTNNGNTSRRRLSAVHTLARFCALGGWPTPFIRALFFCGWIGFGLTALAQNQATFKRLELKGSVWKGSLAAPEDPLNDLKVFIELDAVQPEAGGGIFLSVKIANQGSEPIDLRNPTEWLHIRLYNSVRPAKFPLDPLGDALRVDLPEPPSLVETNTKDPKAFEERWKGRKPFHIREVLASERDSAVKSVSDVQQGIVHLDAGESFMFRAEITRIIGDPKRHWAEKEERYNQPPDVRLPPLDPPQIIPIPPGDYALSVSVSLYRAGPVETAARSSRSSVLIPVYLGPK